jgi:hypothetical protein
MILLAVPTTDNISSQGDLPEQRPKWSKMPIKRELFYLSYV